MKKIFFIILGLYLSISSIIILVKVKDSVELVEILSIKKDYARILTENETIDIPVYLSSENSFFTTKDNIIDARIESDFDELEIKISDIKNQKQIVTYNNKKYFLFYYEVNLNHIYTLGLKLDLINAKIVLTYNNEETLNLELGDFNLMFHDITGSNHLNFTRMYSIHDQEAIIGIYIELVNNTGQNINIKSIDVLNKNMILDLNNAIIVYEPLDYLQPIDNIIPEYNNLVTDFPVQEEFSFKHNTTLFIPIKYLNTFNYINRFPLMINYEYNNKTYDYIIDDYLFYSQISDLYNGLYEIQVYQYYY